jgi:hypothetical protein
MRRFSATLGWLALGALSALGQDGPPKPDVRRGTFRYDRALEGGAYILLSEGKQYDLHGDLSGFKDGDLIEVEGTLQPDRVCIHMTGPYFKVLRVKRLPVPDKKCGTGPEKRPEPMRGPGG